MTKYNRVVILGAAGFIGYHIAKSLAVEAKVELLLVDNFIRGVKDDDFLRLSALQNVSVVELDLSKVGTPNTDILPIDAKVHH